MASVDDLDAAGWLHTPSGEALLEELHAGLMRGSSEMPDARRLRIRVRGLVAGLRHMALERMGCLVDTYTTARHRFLTADLIHVLRLVVDRVATVAMTNPRALTVDAVDGLEDVYRVFVEVQAKCAVLNSLEAARADFQRFTDSVVWFREVEDAHWRAEGPALYRRHMGPRSAAARMVLEFAPSLLARFTLAVAAIDRQLNSYTSRARAGAHTTLHLPGECVLCSTAARLLTAAPTLRSAGASLDDDYVHTPRSLLPPMPVDLRRPPAPAKKRARARDEDGDAKATDTRTRVAVGAAGALAGGRHGPWLRWSRRSRLQSRRATGTIKSRTRSARAQP
jgi:hypothetical protein